MPAKRMTPFASICPDATTWYLVIIGLLLLVGTGQAQIVPMVKQMPFPYPVGIAADTASYASIRAKIKAADGLRQTCETRITSLTAEVASLNTVLDAEKALANYDEVQLADTRTQLDLVNRQLQQAVTDRDAAQSALKTLVKPLPRYLRRIVTNAPSDVMATALIDDMHRQRVRKWTWSAVSIAGGFLLGKLFLTR